MTTSIWDIATRRGVWLGLGAAVAAYAALRVARLMPSPRAQQRPVEHGPRVVILGAGFAGLTAARALRQRLGDRGQITLIDRHNYHLFTPLLYQVATCGVDPYDAAYPVHQFAGRKGIAFRRGTVTGIDFDRQRVALSDGEAEYDYLVVALGTTTNFFGNRAAMEHTLPMKTLEDGVAIRNHVVDMLEQATVTSDSVERRAMLSFVVVGGGATGTETAAALAALLQRVVPVDYPRLDVNEVRVVVIESERKLLGHMSERMARIALSRLRAMGVEVWLDSRAKDVAPDYVETEDGRRVQTRTAIWTTGVRCPDVVAALDAPHGKGGSLVVDDYLQVRGRPGVFAVGDNAHMVDPKAQQSIPLLAEAAVQEGDAVAENVARAVDGRPLAPFRYRPLGNAVSLGRNAGAVEIAGLAIDGFPGWLAWRLIHLAKITSFRNKLATAVDWSVGYVYDQDTARLELEPAKGSIGAGGAGQGG